MRPIPSEQEHEAVNLRGPSRGKGFVRTHQGSSGPIRAHQGSSGLIRAHQGSSGPIRAHQGSSGLIRAHQWRSPRASSRDDHPADVHTFGSSPRAPAPRRQATGRCVGRSGRAGASRQWFPQSRRCPPRRWAARAHGHPPH